MEIRQQGGEGGAGDWKAEGRVDLSKGTDWSYASFTFDIPLVT